MRVTRFWSWFWIALGVLYFFLPLYATFQFSLKAQRDTLSFLAYHNVLNDPKFAETFLFSLQMAVWTILVGVVLVVPAAAFSVMVAPAVLAARVVRVVLAVMVRLGAVASRRTPTV